MIYCLVAIEKSQGIGFEGQMPWPRLSGDMKWFKDRTTDNIVIMGSTTWRSLGKPLPNRINVVISSKLQVNATLTFSDPTQAIKEAAERYRGKDIYIIGGQQLYDSVKELVDVFYVTEIDASYTCDKFFDLEYVKEHCEEDEMRRFPATETTPAYIIKEYTR
jgi:dihydrofolate reductase